MIKRIHLHEFRAFKDINIDIGKSLTLIAGHNATGKSTLLGLLGHSAELKKSIGTPLIKDSFRTEFSELFQSSKKHDRTHSNVCEIFFSDINNFDKETDERFYRVTWQKYKKDDPEPTRFRLIPTKFINFPKKTRREGKVAWPTLYLGLSRLYPLGECDGSPAVNSKSKIPNNDPWILRNYVSILNLDPQLHDIKSFVDSTHNDVKRKKFINVITSQYDYLCNSAGQDNLSQILNALLSFKLLKEHYASKNLAWEGGMLLIDEVDATLHPAAQNKLIDLFHEVSASIGIQIIFTTHSLSLIEHFLEKFPQKNNNGCRLVYLTSANGKLSNETSMTTGGIKADMLLSDPAKIVASKTLLYSEDPETRWFIENIAPSSIVERIYFIDTDFSCDQLLKMHRQDDYFKTVIIAVDGDVAQEKIAALPGNDNIIKLPGDVRPERMLYKYLLSLDPAHPLWPKGMQIGFTRKAIIEYGPDSAEYNQNDKERERDKAWFRKNKHIFEQLDIIGLWKSDNQCLVTEFNTKLRKALGSAAHKSNKC